jgi:NADP-dependent 3-hydroxy acid dehydrogenase YdfG
MISIKNKNIFITGGSSGLGSALAKEFLNKGAKVYVCSRDIAKLNKLKKEINHKDLFCFVCDVRQYAKLEHIINNIGKIDILVNNAGIFENGELDEMSSGQIEDLLDTNLKGLILTTKLVLPLMKRQPQGFIVNIGSTSGISAKKLSSVYCATKWGVTGFSESLKLDLQDTNIKVFIIHPGGMNTEIFKSINVPVNFQNLMDPRQIASIIILMIKKSDTMLMDQVVVNRIKK